MKVVILCAGYATRLNVYMPSIIAYGNFLLEDKMIKIISYRNVHHYNS